MENLERDGYTAKEIKDVLHGRYGSRNVKFRYDLLDKNEVKKGELERVLSGEVSMSALSTLKRTAKFTLQEETLDVQTYLTWVVFGSKNWSDT